MPSTPIPIPSSTSLLRRLLRLLDAFFDTFDTFSNTLLDISPPPSSSATLLRQLFFDNSSSTTLLRQLFFDNSSSTTLLRQLFFDDPSSIPSSTASTSPLQYFLRQHSFLNIPSPTSPLLIRVNASPCPHDRNMQSIIPNSTHFNLRPSTLVSVTTESHSRSPSSSSWWT